VAGTRKRVVSTSLWDVTGVASGLTFLGAATAAFLGFGVLVCMACGVTYAVVPFIRPKAIGSASGIVGAGGNFGAVLAAMLFKSESISGANVFFILGSLVATVAFCALLLRFREEEVPEQTATIASPVLMPAD